MDQEKLFDALDGLQAYDQGCTDSGIKDEILRAVVIRILNEQTREDLIMLITLFLCTYRNKNAGYTEEDHESFLEWIHDEMGIHWN